MPRKKTATYKQKSRYQFRQVCRTTAIQNNGSFRELAEVTGGIGTTEASAIELRQVYVFRLTVHINRPESADDRIRKGVYVFIIRNRNQGTQYITNEAKINVTRIMRVQNKAIYDAQMRLIRSQNSLL